MLNPAANRVETSVYDAATDRLSARRIEGFTLDAAGAVIPFLDETTHTYDSVGRVTEINGPRPQQHTEIDYDATSGSRSALRRYLNGSGPAFLEWTFSNFDARGNPQTVAGPNWSAANPVLGVTHFTYDGLSRVLTATPPYEGTGSTTITFAYDLDGNLTRVDFPPDSTSNPVFLRLGYDAAKPGLLRFLADSQGNAIVYTYDKGRATREERYIGFTDLTSPGTRKGDATFSYDAAGRLFRAFNPLVTNGTVYSEFGHDAKGNPTSIHDENGKQDGLLYDALDRLTKISQVRTATTTTYETDFTYDALSNVTSVTDAAAKTTDLLHDDRGNLVETLSPDTGRTRFLYDAAGNLTTKIENAPAPGSSGGRITNYSYDGLDRLTAINLSSDPDWVFSYDTDAAKNQKGRLASVTNGIVTTQLEYTYRGDVAVERTILDGLAYAVQYQYDAAGNRSKLTVPNGMQIDTSYAGSRPNTLSVLSGFLAIPVTEIEWYPFGPRTHAKFPPDQGAGNLVTSTRTLNLRGQVTELDVTQASGAILDRSYKYDFVAGTPGPNDAGPNLDQVIDHRDAAESRFYFYDELDRLAKASDLAGASLDEYAYDAVGNRTSKIGAAGTTNYSYEFASNRLDAASTTEPRGYAHDAYGNRIYDGVSSFTGTPSLGYDDTNRLIEARDPANAFATLATYSYDAFGRRVRKVTPSKTVLFFYDTEGHLIEEVVKGPGAADDTVRSYIFLEDEVIGLVDKGKEVGTAAWITSLGIPDLEPPIVVLVLAVLAGLGVTAATRRWPVGVATTTSGVALLLLCAGIPRGTPRFFWVHTDPLGTPLAVTTAPAIGPAAVVWRATYEPFGKATVDENADGDNELFKLNVRFLGQYEDVETGWHYNLNRTYDPGTGRYLEVDPLGLTGRSTYEYAFSNPLRYVDPLGLIEMNWFPPGSTEFNNASQIGSDFPVYGFAGHGNPNSVSDPQDSPVGPLGVADAISRDPAWGGRPVVLYSCNTGRGQDPFAQLLADALGALVLAPDNFGWLPPPSNPIRFFIGPPVGGDCCNQNLSSDCCREFFDEIGEKPRPDLGNPGRWRVFIPRGNPTVGVGR